MFEHAKVLSIESLNFKLKTLGGKQFWTDVHHQGGWRIQENAFGGRFRLLDPKNNRHVVGDFSECLKRLNRFKSHGEVKANSGRVVIVTHGLIRTTSSMQKLGRHLQANSNLTAIDFEYASTRRPVADHASALSQLIDSLGEDVTEINFVAHSMGNIVIRHYLADLKNDQRIENRFRRMVMIGPPNQGSKMARVLKRNFLFKIIAGIAGWELGGGWQMLEPHLTIPEFEFGIIAGGQNDYQRLSNFLLPGKDDFTVSVAETELNGASDFFVRPLLHGTMMRNDATLNATLSFIENGYFVSDEERVRIAK